MCVHVYLYTHTDTHLFMSCFLYLSIHMCVHSTLYNNEASEDRWCWPNQKHRVNAKRTQTGTTIFKPSDKQACTVSDKPTVLQNRHICPSKRILPRSATAATSDIPYLRGESHRYYRRSPAMMLIMMMRRLHRLLPSRSSDAPDA